MALQRGAVELGRGAVADDGSLRAVIARVAGDLGDGVVVFGGGDALLRGAVLDLRPANCMRCQTRSCMRAAGHAGGGCGLGPGRERAPSRTPAGPYAPLVCFSASSGSFELMSRVTVWRRGMWVWCAMASRVELGECLLARGDICAGVVGGGWDGGWTRRQAGTRGAALRQAAAPARRWACTFPEPRHGRSLFFTRPRST